MSFYAKTFKELQPNYDPRHIEAYVRLQYGTLDHLDHATFKREAAIAAACIDSARPGEPEELAQSYGL